MDQELSKEISQRLQTRILDRAALSIDFDCRKNKKPDCVVRLLTVLITVCYPHPVTVRSNIGRKSRISQGRGYSCLYPSP